MNAPRPLLHDSRISGFTRLQLVITLLLAGLLVFGGLAYLNYGERIQKQKMGKLRYGKAIYNWLQAYANDHDQRFPEAEHFSNEAFRQLFVGRYIDAQAEIDFGIPGDPWLQNAPGGKAMPDNDIGAAPDFARALMPGECSWYYVTELDAASASTLPLMGNAFSETVGVYSADPAKKGGIFYPRAVWVSVGGSTRFVDVGNSLRVTENRRGSIVDLLEGTRMENVKNPAP